MTVQLPFAGTDSALSVTDVAFTTGDQVPVQEFVTPDSGLATFMLVGRLSTTPAPAMVVALEFEIMSDRVEVLPDAIWWD